MLPWRVSGPVDRTTEGDSPPEADESLRFRTGEGPGISGLPLLLLGEEGSEHELRSAHTGRC